MGIFAGKLDYGRLDPLTRLYVRVLFGTPAGDYRNWEAVRARAASLAPLLLGERPAASSDRRLFAFPSQEVVR